jgi:hypothetical protein
VKAILAVLLLATTWGGAASASEGPDRLEVIGLSLLFPGLGHRAINHTSRGQIFMAADVGTWGGFGGFRLQGHLRRKSYIDMAHIYAGVPSPEGRSDEYYRFLGEFPSSNDYDEEIRREARARYGDDIAARDSYYDAHKMPADQIWQWKSEAEWSRYRDKRNASQLSYKRGRYLLGLAVANRLLAAVDAMRLYHSHGRGNGMSFYLSGDPSEPREPVRLCVSLRLP